MVKRASQRIHKSNQVKMEKSIQSQGHVHKQNCETDWGCGDKDGGWAGPGDAVLDARLRSVDLVPRALGSQEHFKPGRDSPVWLSEDPPGCHVVGEPEWGDRLGALGNLE